MTQSYNNPIGGSPSDIGNQIRTDYHNKNALTEAKKQTYFGQMASTTSMPKNMGKTIKRYHYLPLLDDANINDQGINAAGVSSVLEATIVITLPTAVTTGNGWVSYYAVGEGNSASAAITAAQTAANDIFKSFSVFTTNYGTSKTALVTAGWTIDETNAVTATVVPESGNLYGSSKDVGTISSKLPALSETGGRVNRVGFKRVELTGTLEKFGFFDEYTQESLDFDTDAQLNQHITTEMVKGANEITEDALQIDLLQSAGTIRFGGDATATNQITGEQSKFDAKTHSVISYEDLMRLSIDLDQNRTPKNTRIITGTRMVDTTVINAARYLYIGNELIPMIKKMKDLFDNPAFVSVEKYAAGTTIAEGEIGAVDQFRIIVVPEMQHWAGAGANVSSNAGFRETGGKYDVYPMLVIGDESFTTIGFQTGGSTVKFSIKHVKPGSDISYSHLDPYGEMGFMSIKWYYGFMVLRPERIAICKAVAEF